MIKELFYKWFGLEPLPCVTCEVLKESLSIERQFNKVLLDKLLDKDKSEPALPSTEELKPIPPQFVPWRVRQQMLEAEDRKKAELIKRFRYTNEKLEVKKGQDAIDALEKELDITDA